MSKENAPMPIMLPSSHAERAALKLLGITVTLPLPWSIIAPHEKQAQANHHQSLETLRRRGGLSACEAVAILEDRPWHDMGPVSAFTRLAALVRLASANHQP